MTNNRYKDTFYSVQCGIFEYMVDEEGIHFLDINPAGLDMFGYTREEFFAKKRWTNEEIVYKDDIPEIEKMVAGLKNKGDSADFTYRLRGRDGKLCWVTGNLHVMKVTENSMTIQSVCLNIDRQKSMEQKLRLEQQKMEIALTNSNITIWDYNMKTRECTRGKKQKNLFATPDTTTPEKMIADGRIHPDSVRDLLLLFEAVDNGAAIAESDICMKDDENNAYIWVRITLKRLEDGSDKPHVLGWSLDITKTKKEQELLKEEIRNQDTMESDSLLVKARFNITEDLIESYRGKDNVAVSCAGEKYTDFSRKIIDTALLPEQKEKLQDIFDPEEMTKRFEDGENTFSIEYQRILQGGRQLWVRIVLHLYRDVPSEELMCFLYTYDIDQEKIRSLVFHTMDRMETETLSVLYPDADIFHILHSNVPGQSGREMFYKESMSSWMEKTLDPSEVEEARKKFSLETIKEKLERGGIYTVTSPVKVGEETLYKKWDFYYLDESKTSIAVKRTDITAPFIEQQKQREVLESALLAARQASTAKSHFLSRMSHEIRTPMNAILGMCTLASQALDNPEEVAECISKIGISGHYLLSLINDILDMSRIESGKMLLHKDKFRMDELVAGINTIIYGQTEKKGIDYETIVDNNIGEAYIGDVMKLQQILVNILGNAVKFTPAGGKITFTLHASGLSAKLVRLVFKINDTGCGIKEEDYQRIFEPFEQGDNSASSEYNGTGLGLAISRNLVELMGGSIQCRSIVGVGTEFTVQVPVEAAVPDYSLEKQVYSFSDMHTLIVDDDLVICEGTAKTLKEIGMIPEWVCSGQEAVDRVRKRHLEKKDYNYILVDWKMPEMDGIETSRRIRSIVGPDVTIIIITAYDWAGIEREAKQAGVNMCISKPMFKSTLISAFERTMYQDEAKKTKKEQTVHDFTGIRLLLAEDHPMNAEIARRLLESVHCEIEVAENGLKALEAFTTKPVGYYDGILMDVRMPVMDGLQAAASIRRWNKEDAKTIPIIAMTANAFDEDIEKCREAGMDAHISKPIDTELLYYNISRLIQNKDGSKA